MLPIYLNNNNGPITMADHVLSKNNGTKAANEDVTARHSKWREHSQSLTADFVPGPFDIICARGKAAWNHSGNKRFRTVVKQYTQAYSQANNKTERSVVVSDILNVVRSKGSTGFVKKEKTGEWIQVDNLLAREKVGQMLRNALSSKYRSSVVCKKRRRREAQIKSVASLHGVLQSNKYVRQSMDTLSQATVVNKETPDAMSDDELMAMFAQEQSNMLAHFKADQDGLVDKFLQAEVTACLTLNFDDQQSSSSESDSDSDVEMSII